MGLSSSNLTAALAYNPHPIFGRQHPVSLHIIIPCIGRPTIFRLLESLQPQLEPQVMWLPLHDQDACTCWPSWA